MKTKAILIVMLLSAGMLFTSCKKGGEAEPAGNNYSKAIVEGSEDLSSRELHPEVIKIRAEKDRLDQAEEQDVEQLFIYGSTFHSDEEDVPENPDDKFRENQYLNEKESDQ